MQLPIGEGLDEKYPYRELVGCLMYVMMSCRPDLSASINFFSRYQSSYTECHWNHLKRILRYIKRTIDFELVYSKTDNDTPLQGYADADWGNDVNDRKSISGYVFKVFNCTVSWCSRKQQSVSLSSTEAEYVALCNAACEGIWLKELLEELGVTVETVKIFEDNQACIKIAEEPREHKRMKHIDIKYNFIRDAVQLGKVKVKFLPSKKQIADIMTKALPKFQFIELRKKLGLYHQAEEEC